MMKEIYFSSDYAGMQTEKWKFYYGYEIEDGNEEWCFKATTNGTDTIIPYSKLGTEDMFEVIDNLLAGIAYVIDNNTK